MRGAGLFKNSWIIWILSVGMITLLFILSSTDLIIKENQVIVYSIAAILDETSDANIMNFRKGIERAATELKADVRVIPLYEYGNAADQANKIIDEMDNGIAGIILNPVEDDQEIPRILNGISEKKINFPVTLYDTAASHLNYADIGIDYHKAGEKLGAAIGIEKPDSEHIIFFYTGKENRYNTAFYESCREKLESLNHVTELYYGDAINNYDFRIKISRLPEDYDSKPVIVCLDRLSLDMTAEILDSLPSYKELIGGLYGAGSSMYLLNKLGDNTIDGLIVWNEFAAGYLAVEKTVEQIKFPGLISDEVLDSYYIRSNDLENRSFMKILFPLQ